MQINKVSENVKKNFIMQASNVKGGKNYIFKRKKKLFSRTRECLKHATQFTYQFICSIDSIYFFYKFFLL